MPVPPPRSNALAWAAFILGLAALYNLVWGAVAVLMPDLGLRLLGVPGSASRPLVQCIGMIVGVYGIGYGIAASDPARHWPIVLVGLLGKVLGPLGAVWAVATGTLSAGIAVVNLTNDVVWWLPFGWILWRVYRGRFPSAVVPARTGPGLYPELMGPAYALLAPHLGHFHNAGAPIEVEGHVEVRRGAGWLRNLIADREGFPRAASGVPVHLRVTQEGRREVWHRTFGRVTLRSEQWAAGGLLAERLGHVTLHMEPRAVDGHLEITSVRATAFGLPLPPFLSPTVCARGEDTGDGGIRILVRLGVTPLGLLVEYGGVVRVRGTEGT
jgi:Domain of unknown function (DUF4166)